MKKILVKTKIKVYYLLGEINNIKICDIYKPHGKYRLKSGLKLKKDYIAINQYLWEWFMLNYKGGPEIPVDNKYPSTLFSIEEGDKKTDKDSDNNDNTGIDENEDLKVDNLIYDEFGSSNLRSSELNAEKKHDYLQMNETTNKINSINAYNFNTKFSDFRINKESYSKSIKDKTRTTDLKKLQIKSLISNINIEGNK